MAVGSVAAPTAPLTAAVVIAQLVPVPVLLGRLDREACGTLAAAQHHGG